MGIFDFLGGNQTMPAGAPAEGFDLGDRLMSPLSQIGLQLLANNGRPTTEGMFNGVPQAVAQGARYQAVKKEQKEAKEKENRTLAFLRQNHPDIASYVDGGLDVGEAFTYAMQRQNMMTDNARADAASNRQTAGWNATAKYLEAQGAAPELIELARSGQGGEAVKLFQGGKSGGGEYGLQPIYGRNANGDVVIGQMGKDGSFIETPMPAGFSPLGPQETNFQKAVGTATGTAQGEATAGLPSAMATANMVKAQIDSLKNDPYLPNMVGSVDSWLPNVSSDAARVQSKIDQLQGGAFLEARKLLAGGGQITDYEGKKAEAAFVRMNTAQNEKDFNDALDEFNTNVQAGLAKLQRQSGGSPLSSPSAAPAAAEDPLGLR